MGLENRLVQKMGQSLTITPQLQQAIKLLQLGRLEYQEAIEKELLENPFLEEAQEDPQSNASPSSPTEDREASTMMSGPLTQESSEESNAKEPASDWDDYADSFTDYQGSASLKSHSNFEDRQMPEVVSSKTESLEEHLLQQMRLRDFTREDLMIAQHITGNLDRDGHLECTLEEIAQSCGHAVEDVEEVADVLRFLDPVGCCTPSLQTSLLTQLESRGLSSGLESRLISSHLVNLEKRKYNAIAKAEKTSLDNIAQALATIKTLEPRPGRGFSDETVRYVIPDAYVIKVGDDFVVTLNEDGIPKLQMNATYSHILENGSSGSKENKSYLTERARAASWLIKSIQQRQQTIYRVTQSIVKFQRAFFEQGISHLRPLVLKDIAEDIDMHESTISRITTEKYVHTPQGIFELKFFFSSGVKTAGGSDISSSSVKEHIKEIIQAESPKSPISDQQIVVILQAKNIKIARRTVAKYRETLGIPSSSQRKQIL
jgi:RNA polymerase sigma-54 factor